MRREGSVLVAVLVLLLIGLVGTSGVLYLLTGSLRAGYSVRRADQAELMARSGLEEALLKLKNGECSDGCSFNRSLSSGMSYEVTVEKESDYYLVTSEGKFMGTVKTLTVKVKRAGTEWIPFFLPYGEIELETPKWSDAKIYEVGLKVNGLSGKEAKKELEKYGFQVLSDGRKPKFEDVVSFKKVALDYEPPFTGEAAEVVKCPGGVSISFSDKSVTFDKTCKLGESSVSEVDLLEHPNLEVEVSGKAYVGNMENIKWWRFKSLSKDLFIKVSATEDVDFPNGIKISGSSGNLPGLYFLVNSGKNVTVRNGIVLQNVNFSSGADGNFLVQLSSGGDMAVDGGVVVSGGSYRKDLDLRLYSDKSLSLNGGVSFGSFSAKRKVKFISAARDQLTVSGNVNFSSFSSGEDIEVQIESGENLTLNPGNMNFYSFHSSGDIKLKILSGKVLNLKRNISFNSLSANSVIDVSLMSGENLSAEDAILEFRSFSAKGELKVNLMSNKAIQVGGISLYSFSEADKASLNVESMEDLRLKGPIEISSMSLGKDVSIAVVSGKSILADGDLLDVYSGSFTSELNLFALAKKSVNVNGRIESIYSASFSSSVNTLVWGDESISGDFKASSFSINGLLNYSLVASKSAYSEFKGPLFPFFSSKFSGLTVSDLKAICSDGSGKVREVACNILSSSGGTASDPSGGLKILSGMER